MSIDAEVLFVSRRPTSGALNDGHQRKDRGRLRATLLVGAAQRKNIEIEIDKTVELRLLGRDAEVAIRFYSN
jgi:hypothetical protein